MLFVHLFILFNKKVLFEGKLKRYQPVGALNFLICKKEGREENIWDRLLQFKRLKCRQMFPALLCHLDCLVYINIMNGSQLLWTCDAGISCISETLPVLSEGSNGM